MTVLLVLASTAPAGAALASSSRAAPPAHHRSGRPAAERFALGAVLTLLIIWIVDGAPGTVQPRRRTARLYDLPRAMPTDAARPPDRGRPPPIR
jgi:hypothetical protein